MRVGSQCGLLRSQLGPVLAVWPWAGPLTSLGLSHPTGLYFSVGTIRIHVMSGKARTSIRRKTFFGKKLIFDISGRRYESHDGGKNQPSVELLQRF